MSSMNPQRRLACAMTLSFLVAGATGCSEDDPILRMGEAIHHDDFGYTVRGALPLPHIGARQARSRFPVVHFEVRNDARRVAHPWSNSIAYLVDAHGHRYENDEALQQTLNQLRPFGWAAGYLTRAGTTDTTMLVFDVPPDVPRPLDLMVRGEVLMGDVFDGMRFRRARVRLR
jgi:hypothetical protein